MDELPPVDDAPPPDTGGPPRPAGGPAPGAPEPPLRGFTMTSARRRRERQWLWTVAALGAIVVVTFAVALLRREAPRPAPTAVRAPGLVPPTAAPTAVPPPTATPVLVERESEYVLEPPDGPAATPTPWLLEPAAPAPPRRAAPPPQRLSDCLSVSWTYGQASLRPPQVLIDIAVTNRCDRDLAASEVWFRVTGWREGALVQTVDGHLFSTLHRGHVGFTGIGLPGSQDWYDRITLEVLEGAP